MVLKVDSLGQIIKAKVKDEIEEGIKEYTKIIAEKVSKEVAEKVRVDLIEMPSTGFGRELKIIVRME